MKQYLNLMNHVRQNGTYKEDRTGTGTYSVFGHQMRFNLAEGFPLVTTKRCHLKSIIHELLWFLQGDTNIRYLKENGVRIWDEWADEHGDLGPVYGYQWRNWPAPDGESIDQITNLIELLKKNPDSRRAMVSAWNPAFVDQMALPPCHALFQFYSSKLTRQEREKIIQPGWDGHHSEYSAWLMNLDEDVKGDELGRMIDAKLDELGVPSRRLSCQLYQRSADIFLGVPFNIASYALLTMMVAQVTNMVPGEFIWTGGDCHLYSNHLEQADLQLTRDPLALPHMKLNPAVKDIFGFTIDDFTLIGYDAHPHIKAEVAV